MPNPTIGRTVAAMALFTFFAASAEAGVHDVTAHVFHDMNVDGVYQSGEPALPDVRVTDGIRVLPTGAAGHVDLQVDTDIYRFVTVTVPAGWRPTGAWYHHLVAGQAQPDTVRFGLEPDASRAADTIRMIHIGDTQITTAQSYPMAADLLAMNRIPDQPLFIINAGDIVDDGEIEDEWIYYSSQLQSSALPVMHVVGNHDDDPVANNLEFFEQYVGPPYYSFEMGNWHFVGYNSWRSGVYTPSQDTWLQNDIAAAPAGTHVAVFNHFMVRDSSAGRRSLWLSLGVDAVFSGHHHSVNLSTAPEGIADYTINYTRGGGRDWTPRSYNIVTLHADGSLDSDLRRLLVDHESRIQSPGADGRAVNGPLEILVQAYDSACDVVSMQATVLDSTGWTIATTSLNPQGLSLWRRTLDTAGWSAGPHHVEVTGTFEDGTGLFLSRDFQFAGPSGRLARPIDDWCMFRRDATGSGSTDRSLVPPLELAWVQPVPGMVAHNSPVLQDGRVYLGFRADGTVGEAGLMAFDATTGANLWHRRIPGGMALAPGVFGNTVVANALNDSVYGFDAATGATLWSLQAPEAQFVQAAPTGDETGVLVSSKPYCYLVAPGTGSVLWQSHRIGETWFEHVYSAAVFAGSRVILNTYGSPSYPGGLDFMDRSTGLITASSINGCYRAPVVSGDTLFVVGGDRYAAQSLRALDLNGAQLWTSPIDIRRGMGAPALAQGILVLATRDGTIQGVDAATGTSLWSQPVGEARLDMIHGSIGGSQTLAAPAIAGDVVYIGSLDGRLYAFDLHDGRELWRWEFGMPVASSAAISGNMLFVGCSDGNLYAFKGGSDFSTSSVIPGADGRRPYLRARHRTPDQGSVGLEWYLPAPARVDISVYDLRGARVADLVSESMPAGRHEYTWDGLDRNSRRAASGVYFARIRADGFQATTKLVIVH